jgi:hypothetical protein
LPRKRTGTEGATPQNPLGSHIPIKKTNFSSTYTVDGSDGSINSSKWWEGNLDVMVDGLAVQVAAEGGVTQKQTRLEGCLCRNYLETHPEFISHTHLARQPLLEHAVALCTREGQRIQYSTLLRTG